MGDFAKVNEAYAEIFGNHKPARACVAVKTLPKNVDVEIDCIAVVAQGLHNQRTYSPKLRSALRTKESDTDWSLLAGGSEEEWQKIDKDWEDGNGIKMMEEKEGHTKNPQNRAVRTGKKPGNRFCLSCQTQSGRSGE